MASGIIAEFDPFHNGHKYLLEQAANDDGTIVIMSGSFVQRGGISLTDKWSRAEAALKNGADLVIELPVIYSMNTAQRFAYGAIAVLAATGAVTELVFGSECGDTNALKNAAELLNNEPPDVSLRLKKYLADGLSYPAARAKAYEGYIDTSLLSSPNDTLAIEYMRSSLLVGAIPSYKAVKRIATEHNGTEASNTFASASLLRDMLRSGDDISEFTPMHDIYIYDPHNLDTAIIALLRSCGSSYLSSIADVTEGLENRFISAAMQTDELDELIGAVKSKRYPLSRLRRIAYSAFLGITKAHSQLSPTYIRILGFNDKGRLLLRKMKTTASLPVVVKSSSLIGDPIFEINRRAEDLFSLCAPNKMLRIGGRDVTKSPIIIH